MQLSKAVVVQHHSHLTLTLDFQGQILKMLYQELRTVTSPMTLTLNYQGQILKKGRNSRMGYPIDMEQKGCESTEGWSHVVTCNFVLNHDLNIEFSTLNLEIAVPQEWDGRSTWNERDMSR